ncbi:MAG: DUF3192 domain-containing protein [Gammaproteobacteria bacterium]|nr:DUF3192 domain-containing protein [Gammaproteobacteria bacterium]
MKKSLIALLVMAPLSLSLTGCVVAIGDHDRDNGYVMSDHDRQYENRKQIATLMVNATFSAVQDKMGVPDFNETYDKNGETIQVLFYRTHRVHKDDLTTKDECTPLVFKQNKLVSWGDKALRQL